MAATAELETRKVGRTGVKLTVLGFGGASVGNLYQASTDDEALTAMQTALDHGIRYFDTAPHYGHGLSEVRFGELFGGRRPPGVVISTKVGRVLDPAGPEGPPDHGFVEPLPFAQRFDYSHDGIMRSFEESQQRMKGLPIDLLYMHDIGRLTHGDAHAERFRTAMNEGFPAMMKLQESGAVKAIGLGVNEWEVCAETLKYADPDLFMLAGRYTLLEREPAEKLFPQCQGRGISVVAAAPFNSGLLARRPDSSSHYNYVKAPEAIIARARSLFDMIEGAGACLQTAALQFPLRHPVVVSVVGGMSKKSRVESTLSWFRGAVPETLWQRIDAEGDDMTAAES